MNKPAALLVSAAAASTLLWAGTLSAAAPPNGGTVSIEVEATNGSYDDATPAFVDAVAEALGERGFTILQEPGHAAYVAELILSRVEVGTGSAKVSTESAAVMPGNALSVGAAINVPLPSNKRKLVPLQRVRLEIRLKRRGQEGYVWQGGAVTVRAAGTHNGSPSVLAPELGEAVLRSYPVSSIGVISVP